MEQILLNTGWWIPGYGLLGAILTIPWMTRLVRRTGPRPAAYLNILMTIMALIHGSVIFQMVWNKTSYHIAFNWFQIVGLELNLTFELSSISVGAMTLVNGLSLLVQLFALGYMEKDWASARFLPCWAFLKQR
jgi:NAD(P)H-quinone oxidoreductase subunit 5